MPLTDFDLSRTFGQFVLSWNGIPIMSWIERYKVTPRRKNEAQERQNFWSPNVYLDGKYPALVWDHEFTMYYDGGRNVPPPDRWDFVPNYISFVDDLVTDLPYPLLIVDDVGKIAFDLGYCYFISPQELVSPEALLMYSAGLIKLRFKGNTKPVVG